MEAGRVVWKRPSDRGLQLMEAVSTQQAHRKPGKQVPKMCCLSQNSCWCPPTPLFKQTESRGKEDGYVHPSHWRRGGRSVKLTWSSKQKGEGNGTPLQYFCLENHMNGEAW